MDWLNIRSFPDLDEGKGSDEGEEDLVLRCLLELSETRYSNGSSESDFSPGAIWEVLLNKHEFEAASFHKNGSTIHRSRWLELLSRISDRAHLLSAFDLHASASQALSLGIDDDGETGRADAERTFFATVCLLLCCMALNKPKEDLPSIQRRPKRWQSLVLETVRLFQSRIVAWASSKTPETAHLLEQGWIPLWVEFVVPSTHSLQERLLDQSGSSTAAAADDRLRISSAYHAGLVATTVQLARLGVAALRTPLEGNGNPCTRLVECLLNFLPSNWDRVLLCHPYRRHFGDALSPPEAFRSLQAALFYWTTAHGMESEDDDRKESVSWMNTQWDDLGVASLAAVAIERRAFAWSGPYCWLLWLPHVAVLMNAEDTGMEDDSTTEKWVCSRFVSLGYTLLEQILQFLPSSTLRVSRPLRGSTALPPDNPTRTFQLLSNRIVAHAVDSRKSPAAQQSNGGAVKLPNGIAAFQTMQRLLAKYVPRDQVFLVRRLVEDCPHPGLRPKLLDLLRPFVQWEPAEVVDVWDFCNSLLKDLEAHASSHSRTTAPFLINVEELGNSAEFYTSCLSLLYLWIRIRHSTPAIDSLISRVSEFHVMLHSCIIRSSDGQCNIASLHYSRLHLLEAVLQQILDSVKH